jgi:1,4-alpha-glucan branching enzyme
MIAKAKKKGDYQFSFRSSNGAQVVQLAGSFNGWHLIEMKKQKNGAFTATVPLKKGAYEYKFKIGEDWQLDPDNESYSLNSFGTLNSVCTVE